MCGVIGFTSKHLNEDDINLIKSLYSETQIRGKHATGISFWDDGKIVTEKYPISSKEFVKKFDWTNLEKYLQKEFVMIGHIRYSTSDVLYNQPIADETFSIAHNGVISQKEPEEWLCEYGYNCKTKNDSELLFHFLKENNKPEEINNKFHGASFSIVGIKNGKLFNFRNGLRPQWVYEDNIKKIVASTRNILYRCGINDVKKVNPIQKEFTQRNMGKAICKKM